MVRLTVEQDMKLGSALDQLEDALEAAHASLKMVRWAQLNVARYAGGVLGAEFNASIRSVALDVEKLWELAQVSRTSGNEQAGALYDFIEDHNRRILDVIMAHDGMAEAERK
ncbi:hypothetical protein AMST5_03972 [freshwater sediment metagenome]|jgi:hypothetical protein|uniref:Uncharacterized protein n=1 Tax=freshwater sediment metagenome TaxID=556182 RepID=A0AA48RFT1_9ZZZZ